MEFNQSSFSSESYDYRMQTSHLFNPDVDANRELPLTQPTSAHSSITSGSCPGTPEMRRRQEEAMRRLASQVQWGSQVASARVALEHSRGQRYGDSWQSKRKHVPVYHENMEKGFSFFAVLEKYFITMEPEP